MFAVVIMQLFFIKEIRTLISLYIKKFIFAVLIILKFK